MRTAFQRWALTVACGLVVGGLGKNVHAADVNAAASGDWSTAGTWNPAEPTAGDVARVDGGFNVAISQAGEVAQRLDVGNANGATGTVTMTGGDLTIAGSNLPSIRVGQFAGSTGTFNMSGGTININGGTDNGLAVGDLMVGDVGAGTMTMSGGTVNVSDEVTVGTGNGSVGNLTITGGTITNGSLPGPGGRSVIAGFGLNSQGTINVNTAGNLTARFDVVLGFFDNAKGTLNLGQGGTVNANFLFASANINTTSVINQTGGTFNTQAGFVIGQRGKSTYNLSGGVMNGNFVSVGDDSVDAELNITGGTINAANEFLVSVFAPSNGRVNQSAGIVNAATVTVSRDGILGNYNQTGGQLNAGRVFLGDFDSTYGNHNISGGAITVTGNYSVGGALASNAPADAVRTGDQGQALDAKGRLYIRGSAATITVGGDFLANPSDKTRPGAPNAATLAFELLSNSGTSLISVAGAADLDGAVIDMALDGYIPTYLQTFTLLTAAEGIGGDTGTGPTKINGSTGEAFTLAAGDSANWVISVVSNGGTSESLVAQYIPEPATAALLTGVTSMLLRRRRGASR